MGCGSGSTNTPPRSPPIPWLLYLAAHVDAGIEYTLQTYARTASGGRQLDEREEPVCRVRERRRITAHEQHRVSLLEWAQRQIEKSWNSAERASWSDPAAKLTKTATDNAALALRLIQDEIAEIKAEQFVVEARPCIHQPLDRQCLPGITCCIEAGAPPQPKPKPPSRPPGPRLGFFADRYSSRTATSAPNGGTRSSYGANT
jgi:hypothetical protein